jgi:hypothetical protein
VNQESLKYIAGAFLYALWAAIVFAGKADAQPLVLAIGTGIGALLGYHGMYTAITKLQAVTPPLPPAGAQE